MQVRRHGRSGFTLIELLVVIAIIGILAAMLFPVFARARESARKIQCLSNVKNIALAINMYLTDYDALPPDMVQPDAVAAYGDCSYGYDWLADPYLRWPVILDEYIKNRDVWRCPSARNAGGAAVICPGEGYPGGWLQWWIDHDWGYWPIGACSGTWPPGWGGAITDSLLQGSLASAGAGGSGSGGAGVFVQSISTNALQNRGVKPSSVGDTAKYVICGDGGLQTEMMYAEQVAYPDVCGMLGRASDTCWEADWANCPDTVDCGAIAEMKTDGGELLKARTRHMGGVNIGFLDGHAKWWMSRAVLAAAPRWKCGCRWSGGLVSRDLLGIEPCGNTTAAGSPADGVAEGTPVTADSCGIVPLY